MDQRAPDTDEPLADLDDSAVTLHVCVTCRGVQDPSIEDPKTAIRHGRLLHEALAEAQRRQPHPLQFRIATAECLSNCNRGCSVALTGPGRWSYIYGDLTPASVDELLDGAARYAASADGLVPWRERPMIFRKGVIARIPPIPVKV